MKQDLLVCFHCYGVWSAKTPLKVSDTSISVISFFKLTIFGFDCGFTYSSRGMRDMVTADSGWGTLKLYKVKKPINWNCEDMTNLSIFDKLWQYYYKYAEICKISPNLVCNEEKLKTKLNKVGSRAVCLETR